MYFSDLLKDQLRTKSHAMAEEVPCYEDEGVNPEDVPEREAYLEFALDSLEGAARTEWTTNVEIFGREKCMEEAMKYVVDP